MRKLLFIFCLSCASTFAANGLLDNLVAYYKCDEASGNVLDAHTGGRNLTQVGTIGAGTGLLNGDRTFAPGSERAISSDTTFGFTAAFSASGWIKPAAIGSSMTVVSKDEITTANSRGWGVIISSGGKLAVYVSNSAGSSVTTLTHSLTLVAGTWYHFLAMWNGSTLSLSVTASGGGSPNAFETTAASGTAHASSASFALGARFSSGSASSVMNGEVDEVAIWSQAKDSSALTASYNAGAPFPYSSYDSVPAITITTPVSYQVFQRNGRGFGNISVTGTYAGTPTSIEAQWNGGSWTTISASPTLGSYSGTLSSQPGGQGTLTVRFVNDTSTTASRTLVGVGDIFVCAGQSNMSGRGDNNQSYSHATLKACLFGNDYTWKELSDPYDSTFGQVDTVSQDTGLAAGSFVPLLATKLMARSGVPVAFVPCAMGSTEILQHQPGADHQNRSTLYGSLVYRGLTVGGVRMVLWFQGETDAANGTDQATYNSRLDTLADAIYTDVGVRTMAVKIHLCTDRDVSIVNAAIGEAWGDNSHVLIGPNMYFPTITVSADGVHVKSDAGLAEFAERFAQMIYPRRSSMF